MAKRLNRWVHVGDQSYGPGYDVPADVAELITNPNVWDDGDPEPAAASVKPAGKPKAAVKPKA